MVVISLVRSNERGRIGFLRVPNRLNVAISRARRLVVCVGDAATLRAGEETMYGRLVEAARSCGGYLRATDLLGSRAGVRPRPVRRAVGGIPGALQEGDPNAPRRSRRRRRRPQGGPGQTTVAPDTTTIAAQPTSEAGDAAGQPAKRRRHRHRSRGGWAGNPAVTRPDGVTSTPPPPGAPRPPGDGARRRRNRHRRRGPRPLGDQAPGGQNGSNSPPLLGGGSAPG